MKKLLLLLFMFCFAGNLYAQEEHAMLDQWPALAQVHSILSATYHPAEKGDLAPIKARAAELAQAAKKLTPASIPANWRSAQMKRAIKELQSETQKVKQLIGKQAPDAQITAKLSVAHDAFHRIMSLTGDAHEEAGRGNEHQMQHGVQRPENAHPAHQNGGQKSEHGRKNQ